jgi:hypothetical protein
MVYQRFLDAADLRCTNVAVTLNGDAVVPWDPFCLRESSLVAHEDVEVELPSGGKAAFVINAYVLPRKDEFTTPEAHTLSRLGNDTQGIYIYRENRLIHEADWLGMYQKEPHFSLLRVELSFDHRFDEAFHIDIKKSQIQLSSELWEWIRTSFLPPARREAEKRYRKGQAKSAQKRAADTHDASNRTIAGKAEELDMSRINVRDPASNTVEVSNMSGTSTIRLKLTRATKPHQYFVQPVPSIDDGLLWEPALIDGRKGVQLNTGHPYYHKVYLPNVSETSVVQGIDSLLWSLATAELAVVSSETKKYFADLRYFVSRQLRELVDDLPEAVDDVSDSGAPVADA